MSRLGFVPLLAGVAALFLGTAVVLHGSSRPAEAQEPAIEAAIQSAVSAWNAKDLASFAQRWTDSAFEAEFEFTKADLAILAEFIGDPPITLLGVSDVQVTGTTATAIVELTCGSAIERGRYTFTFNGSIWQISEVEDLAPVIPSGVTTVDVRLQEYAFVYDRAAVAGGNVAFRVANVGVEEHELALVRLDTTVPLLELIESEGEPEGVQSLGAVFADPGEQTAFVMTEPLRAGRYAMLCFFPDAAGTPHAFLGMVSEFNVGAGTGTGGGTISPPSTGDAGLLGVGANALLPIGLTATVLLFAGAGLVRARQS